MSIHDLTGLLGVVMWPIVTLVMLVLVRKQLLPLIGRVREVAGPGNVKIAFDQQTVKEVAEAAREGHASTELLTERLKQSVTAFSYREARILRALLDDDGRAIYNYQTEYYRDALDSLIKQGYVQKMGKGFTLTQLGKEKTKDYLLEVLRRM
jgi:hypothetical protein